jgi:predicted DNA-binding protein
MARKPLLAGRKGESPIVGVRMSPIVRDRLARASKAQGVTLSEYMRRAVEAAIDAEEGARAS